MQNRAFELRRIPLPRTRVNRGLGIKNRAYTTSRQAYPNKNGALEGPVLIPQRIS